MKIADTVMKFLAVAVATSLPLTAALAQPAAPTAAPAPVVVPANATTVTTTTVATPVAEDPVAAGVNTVAPGAVQTAAAMATTTAVETTSPVTTVTTTTATAVPPVPTPIVVPAPAAPVTTSLTNAPTGLPSVVGEVMQNLQQSQNNLSLNDMAKAQDALVRLNLMLDIEKKLGDIKKVQDDRNGTASNGGGGLPMTAFGAPNIGGAMQVPASALALPEPAAAPAPERHHASRASDEPATSASDYTVEQITGTNGNLVAVLTSADGTRKNVRVGDTLGSRLKVASISGSGVELQGPKGSKTIGIENNGLALAPMMR